MLQPFAEPDDPRKAVDHPKTFAGGGADQQAAVICAEIQGCEGSTCGWGSV
jgi:hypothetical protein